MAAYDSHYRLTAPIYKRLEIERQWFNRDTLNSMACLYSKPPLNLGDMQQSEQSALPGALRGYHYPAPNQHSCHQPPTHLLWL